MLIKVSVVIPTYKRYGLLRRCLEALMSQSLDREEYEVIVVSDGYDPKTEEIVTYEQLYNFRYLFLPEKKGPAAARNVGWQAAVSDLIVFTDDDTIPHFNWLLAYLQNRTGALAEAFTGKVKVPRADRPTDYEMSVAHLEHADFVTANCACTRTALEMVNGFDERFTLAWREDSDLEFKLIQQKIPIHEVPEALVVHPVRKAGWGISLCEQKKSMLNALLYKKFPVLYRERIRRIPNWRYYIMVLLFLLAVIGWACHLVLLFQIAGCGFLLFWLIFTIQRLKHTSKSVSHIFEMMITSALIPFIALYWHFYGAFKYRVFFL